MEHRHDHDTHDNHGYYNKEKHHTNDSHHDENGLHVGHDYYENQQYYYHPDHLGSSSYITDTKGKVYEHLEYFPFGETWAHEHYNTNTTPYKFTGKELDEETGLYYYGARYYDPRTSVWQSPDPILAKYMGGEGNGGVFNSKNLSLFSYTANNPVNFVDPDGKELVRINTSQFQELRENISYENQPRAQRGIIVDRKFAGQAAKYLGSWIKEGYEIQVNNSFRTTEEQKHPRLRGKATKDTSAHEAGAALDISVRKKGSK